MRAVNLIPTEQRSGQPVGAGRSQGGAYAVLGLVAGLALMAFLYGSAQHQIASRRSHAAALVAQAQQEQSAAERLAPYTSFIALRNQRVQDVQTLVDSRFDWAHVMHEFGRVLPIQASISSLSGTIGAASAAAAPSTPTSSTAATGSSVSSSTPPGSVPSFTLAGCATSQSMVALTLERLRLIDGVKEVTLQSSTAATGSTSTGGDCHASFSADVNFNPLPSAAAIASATKASTKTVSDPASTGTSAATSTSGVSAR